MQKTTYEILKEIEEDFFDITSYAEWCDEDEDGDRYYCKEFIESLHEILDELVDAIADYFGEDKEDPDTVFEVLSESADIDNYAEFYWEISNLNLVNKYGIVRGGEDEDFVEMSMEVESMLSEIICLDWEEDDDDE